MPNAASNRTAPGERLPLLILLCLFFTLLVRTAWICDDAYITFRVADNFLGGYGLRWNTIDRVQAFTNPLWLFVMTALAAVTKDYYYTSLLASFALSMTAVWLVARRVASSAPLAILALLALSLSKAFVDYSTSGLENPLGHVLLALFLARYFADTGERAFERLALLAGLIGLNRLDGIVLILPALAFAAFATPRRRALRALALGFLPLATWMLFSLFYYGFAFPNTAYAKLNTGAAPSELVEQGFYYLFNSLSIDPLTLVLILLAIGVVLASRDLRGLPVALGLIVHLAYVVRVGGDFMSGRFLSGALLAAVITLARSALVIDGPRLALCAATFGTIALAGPAPTLTATAYFFTDRFERRTLLDERGITDERAIYYRYTGLMTARRGEPMPNHHRAVQGRRLRAEGVPLFHHGQIGILGFYAGPNVHIMEANALTDAFLARLPARPGWRIGHFVRALPPGYEASLRKGVNRIDDPKLRRLYAKLALVTRAPLLDPGRLAAIAYMNWGEGRHLADDYFEIHARQQSVTLADVSVPRKDGDDWQEGKLFSDRGLEVKLGTLRHPRVVEMSLDGNDTYKVACLRLGVSVGEIDVPPRVVPAGGLSVRRVDVDVRTASFGCDALQIRPVTGDGNYSLGHLVIVEELDPKASLPPDALVEPEPPDADAPGDGEKGKQDERLPSGR